VKQQRNVSPTQSARYERELFQAVLALRTAAEARAFFRDLCTPAELEAMADRWAVVAELRRGLPYRKIHEKTGVSVTTIGRVARCLQEGQSGYAMVAERLVEEKRT
jgi:TrpR-related protein YerC/YecD